MPKTIALVALIVIAVATQPAKAVAQTASTCGWSFVAPVDTPASISQALARFNDRAAVSDAVDNLMRCYRSCDTGAGREAIRLLKFARNGDDATRGLLGIAMVRGPDVQVEGAPGAVAGNPQCEQYGIRGRSYPCRRAASHGLDGNVA